MNIAIFADLHGRILLAWKLVERYQRETGTKIDLILQCGDMGAFPDLTKLDRATLKYAQLDRSELGFYDYFCQNQPEVEAVLNQLDCNMVAVRGNHEDHDFLDGLEQQSSEALFPIDCYKRVFMLKTGHTFVFKKGEEEISILGIGRTGDRKGRTRGPYIQPYEQAQLKLIQQQNPAIDVLISHDSALDFSDYGYGMKEIRDILNQLLPEHHFYGHTGKPFSKVMDENELSFSWKVKELEYKQNRCLETGCMLILNKENNQITVDAVTDDWLLEYTKDNWMYVQ